jgi:hypothetical protein
MGDARADASGGGVDGSGASASRDDAGADAAAAAAVAPLLALQLRVDEARLLQRSARALELAERALEQAQRSQPHDSFIVAALLEDVVRLRVCGGEAALAAAGTPRGVELICAAWATDARALPLSRARLAVFCMRIQRGTLRTLTREERAFFTFVGAGSGTAAGAAAAPEDDAAALTALDTLGEEALLAAAAEAVSAWPAPTSLEEVHLLATGVRGALDAALALDARRALEPALRQRKAARAALAGLFAGVLGVESASDAENADAARLLRALRGVQDGLSSADEAALRRLEARVAPLLRLDELLRWDVDGLAEARARAAADVARHGLRACGLPDCAKTEPQPRVFKLCSRCRGVAYCGAEHQRADWRRHKRVDGCAASAS